MNYSKNIYIFSDHIGVGKTSTLLNWAKSQRNIGGFLSPKISGKRYFLNLENLQIRPMEKENGTIKIGQFKFDENIFKWARYELYQHFQTDKRGLIIDEVGPLEIKNNDGFHPLILDLLKENSAEKPDLIFVVRNFMVKDFIEKYQLSEATIVPRNFFKNQSISKMNGLVLCGGESKRMQSDKALLKYAEQEQWKNLNQILKPFCEENFISINQNQWESWANSEVSGERLNFIIDDSTLENLGPLNGIYSATKKDPERSLLISGIDYPLVKTEHFIELNNERDENFDGVFFEKEGFTEPLIGVLERRIFPQLWDFVGQGGKSFQQFLETISIKKVIPENTDFLVNINTLEDFEKFKNG